MLQKNNCTHQRIIRNTCSYNRIMTVDTSNDSGLKLMETKQNDLYIATVYNSPINSSYTANNKNDIFNQLQNKIATFSATGRLIIGGNFTARTAILSDCVNEVADDVEHQNFPNGYDISLTRERNNRDKFKNEYGENLTELCSTTNLRILSGRILGEFTYYGFHELRTVDYILTSENVIKDNQIRYMRVQPLTFLSDHRPLLLKLSHHSIHATPKEGAIPLQNIPEKL